MEDVSHGNESLWLVDPNDLKLFDIPDYAVNLDYYWTANAGGDALVQDEGPAAINHTLMAPNVELGYEFENDDASWIMSSTFMIFTMQTGFGLIESGMCHMKNEVNILMTNVLDVALNGISFWTFGYGFAFGNHSDYKTSIYGVGDFFFSPDINKHHSGEKYLHFFYQLALASTCTTIPSGSMAERANFKAVVLFNSLSVFIYVFPAHWMWDESGWLRNLGARDLAGAGLVHLIGGFSGLTGAYMLGPRTGFQEQHERIAMGNAKNSLIGLFMMWWGALAFNSGSTFGVTGQRWAYAARSTVTTMLSSFGGGLIGMAVCYIFYGGKIIVSYVCMCVFGSLAAITGSCYLVKAWEAIVIGLFSGCLTFFTALILERSKLDDACGSFAIHGVNGVWGLIALGIFGKKEHEIMEFDGLLYGGGFYLVSIQVLAALVFAAWSMVITALMLSAINKVVPIRSPLVSELLGADYTEHNILHGGIGIEKAVDVLHEFFDDIASGLDPTGNNLGHMMYLENTFADGFESRPQKDGLDDNEGHDLESGNDEEYAHRKIMVNGRYLEMSKSLSVLLGADVSAMQVKDYVNSQSAIQISRPPRPTTGGGAFGRQLSYAVDHP